MGTIKKIWKWVHDEADGTITFKFLAMVLLVGFVLAVVLIPPQGKVETCPVPATREVLVKKNVEIEHVLVEYILTHSNRISRGQAKEIVDRVFETKKPLLLIALMEEESTLLPSALSPRGAMGLLQIRPVTDNGTDVWEKMLIKKGIIKERRDLFEITPNIRAGNEVLSIYIEQAKGDIEVALTSYLSGRDGWYVKRVFARLAKLYVLTEAVK